MKYWFKNVADNIYIYPKSAPRNLILQTRTSDCNSAYKKNTYQSLKFLILTVLMAVSVGAALTKQETDNVQQRMKIIEQKIEMQEEGKEPEEDGTIHEMHVHGDADNRHNKGHKEQIKVYKERGINVNDDRARDGKRCVGMLFKTWNMGGNHFVW